MNLIARSVVRFNSKENRNVCYISSLLMHIHSAALVGDMHRTVFNI